MWNPFGKKQAEVISHWYSLIPNFTASTQEFYALIEKALQTQQVPGLEISRVDFAEGGVLSAKREYLRMTRERLVFDICAAPFGTSYFFSMRFAEIPTVVKLWQLLLFLFLLFFPLLLVWKIFGFFFGSIVFIVSIVSGIYAARNAVAMGLQDLDATLIKLPVIGPIYERFIRKETYYRIDTRIMYLETVDSIVKQKVEEVTSAKGIKLLNIKQHSPLLDDFYKPIPLPPASNFPVSPISDGMAG